MRKLPLLQADPAALKKISWKIALAAFLLCAGVLKAEDQPGPAIWLINTRCAPVSGDAEQGKSRIAYWRLDEHRQWNAETAVSFAAGGSKCAPLIFLVHGNRTTDDEAVQFARPFYSWLGKQPCGATCRVVIWSWPGARLYTRTRPDVQTKACYCDIQSYYLADCLRGLKSDTPVGLVGYSFGARIIAGGLHLLGGGTLAGRRLPDAPDAEKDAKRLGPIRAALIAAAFDCFALAPGQQFDCAAAQAEDLLVTRNGCDDALRWYPLLYHRGGPQALGYTGPCCGSPENIQIFEASSCVGKSHHWEDYIYCPHLFNALPHCMFADEK
jgi:hypothetical protein